MSATDLQHKLLATTDASVWASEFCAMAAAGTIDPTDFGLMVGWFANAIETGRAAGAARGTA